MNVHQFIKKHNYINKKHQLFEDTQTKKSVFAVTETILNQ